MVDRSEIEVDCGIVLHLTIEHLVMLSLVDQSTLVGSELDRRRDLVVIVML